MSIDAKEKAFLDLISWCEGTGASRLTGNRGYDVIVTGVDGPSVFSDYTTHPFANGRGAILVRPPCAQFPKGLFSDASGRYQLMLRWWRPYKTLLSLTDFSPASQDAIALQQIKERRAIALIESGNFGLAIQACSNIWASFPGNAYGQGGRSMAELQDQYQTLLQAELKSAA